MASRLNAEEVLTMMSDMETDGETEFDEREYSESESDNSSEESN